MGIVEDEPVEHDPAAFRCYGECFLHTTDGNETLNDRREQTDEDDQRLQNIRPNDRFHATLIARGSPHRCLSDCTFSRTYHRRVERADDADRHNRDPYIQASR